LKEREFLGIEEMVKGILSKNPTGIYIMLMATR
jgi:hypothetical protein